MKIEFAKSLSGHDKNRIYLIWKMEEGCAWLVDGRSHTVKNPKKKNKKHFQAIKNIPEEIQAQLQGNESWSDEKIRRAVKEYERSINQ